MAVCVLANHAMKGGNSFHANLLMHFHSWFLKVSKTWTSVIEEQNRFDFKTWNLIKLTYTNQAHYLVCNIN